MTLTLVLFVVLTVANVYFYFIKRMRKLREPKFHYFMFALLQSCFMTALVASMTGIAVIRAFDKSSEESIIFS